MPIFARKPDKRIAEAEKQLAAAVKKQGDVASREGVALADAAAHAAWRNEYEAAASDVHRLSRYVASLQSDDEAQRKHEADAALRKRIEDVRTVNRDLADRMRIEGVRLSLDLKRLLRDVSAAVLEAAAVNRELPAGVAAVVDANSLARGVNGFPREEISSEVLSLWAFRETGERIDRQDLVVETAPGIGMLPQGGMPGRACIKRKFRQVTYRPFEGREIPEHVHTTVRLPFFDRSGIDFEGAIMVIEHVAALDVEEAKASSPRRQRSIATEIVPNEPWVPPVPKPLGLPDDAVT